MRFKLKTHLHLKWLCDWLWLSRLIWLMPRVCLIDPWWSAWTPKNVLFVCCTTVTKRLFVMWLQVGWKWIIVKRHCETLFHCNYLVFDCIKSHLENRARDKPRVCVWTHYETAGLMVWHLSSEQIKARDASDPQFSFDDFYQTSYSTNLSLL